MEAVCGYCKRPLWDVTMFGDASRHYICINDRCPSFVPVRRCES